MKKAHVRSYLATLGSPTGFDYVRKRTPLKMTRGVERTMLTKNFTRSKVFCGVFVKKATLIPQIQTNYKKRKTPDEGFPSFFARQRNSPFPAFCERYKGLLAP